MSLDYQVTPKMTQTWQNNHTLPLPGLQSQELSELASYSTGAAVAKLGRYIYVIGGKDRYSSLQFSTDVVIYIYCLRL